MSKFIKKPVVVEATQWFKMGDHPAVTEYCDNFHLARHETCSLCGHLFQEHGAVITIEDVMDVAHRVCPGDWIVTGVKSEHYPCKPDIFAMTYEGALQGIEEAIKPSSPSC